VGSDVELEEVFQIQGPLAFAFGIVDDPTLIAYFPSTLAPYSQP
jgi:hypothetical protein